MFTQSEIAVLKNMLKDHVQFVEHMKTYSKKAIADNWKYCDKDTPEGVSAFIGLNEEKNFLRMLCKKHKQYSTMLYKLKKLQKVKNV